jgi:DNA damage-inducible protein 1
LALSTRRLHLYRSEIAFYSTLRAKPAYLDRHSLGGRATFRQRCKPSAATNSWPKLTSYPLTADAHTLWPLRRITLSIFNLQEGEQDNLLTLDVFPEMTVSTLRESIQAESNISPTSQHIYHNGRLISDDSKTMEQLEIGDGEMLAVHVRDMRSTAPPPPQPPRQAQQPQQTQQHSQPSGRPQQDPEVIRLQVLGNPALRQQIQRQNPDLAAALDSPEQFARILRDSYDREQRERLERQREIERLNDDPFNIENQRKIEEMIRQERVMENLQNAMEHNPEGEICLAYPDSSRT